MAIKTITKDYRLQNVKTKDYKRLTKDYKRLTKDYKRLTKHYKRLTKHYKRLTYNAHFLSSISFKINDFIQKNNICIRTTSMKWAVPIFLYQQN